MLNFGSNLSGKDADLLEDVINEETLLTTLTLRPCVQFLFGEQLKPGSSENLKGGLDDPPGVAAFKQVERWGGRGKKLRLGEEDGNWEDLNDTFAAQSAGVVPVEPKVRGEAVFYYDHLHLDHWLTFRDWVDAQASPKKMDNLVAESQRALAASLATKLSLGGFHGTGTPGKDSIGSWRDLIATTGLYGGIDRALNDNANFVARQYTSFSIATWTYKKVLTAMAKCQGQGGLPTLMPMTETMFVNAQDAIFQEFTPAENNELTWIKGNFPRVGSLRMVLDEDTGGAGADENTTCVLDSRYFRVLWKKMVGSRGQQTDFALNMWERNRNLKAMMQLQADAMVQVAHIHPKVNVGIYN